MSAEHVEHSADAALPAHDQAEEVAHAWHHLWLNARFFAAFFSLILITVAFFYVDISTTGNLVATLLLSAARAALIAFFLTSMVRPFNLVVSTLIFTVLFFIGMIGLSLWAMGDPIVLPKHH